MRINTFILAGILAVFTVSGHPAVKAQDSRVSYMLSVIDDFVHSPKEFLNLMLGIQYYNPGYNLDEIGNFIAVAYDEINKYGEVSAYAVAEGIYRFSADELGIDLKSLVTSFVFSQIYEKKGVKDKDKKIKSYKYKDVL